MIKVSADYLPDIEVIVKLHERFEDANLTGLAGILDILYLQDVGRLEPVNAITIFGVNAQHEKSFLSTPEWCLPRVNPPGEAPNAYQNFLRLWEIKGYIHPSGLYLLDSILLEAVLYYWEDRPFNLFSSIQIA